MSEPSESFEEALTLLEESVERLEAGDLKLEEALAVFEQGVAASRTCSQWLDHTRKRVQVLTADDEGQFRLDFLDGEEDKNENENEHENENEIR